MRLLHLDASPRAERSRTRPVAKAWLEALAGHADVEIETIDLWAADLPSLGGAMIEGRYARIMGEPLDSATEGAWTKADAIAQNFIAADGYLIATPMWNFGLPYVLKHFIDVVTQPRIAFTNDATGAFVGHAAGKPAMIIAASALPYPDGSPAETLEFQLSYLRAWLNFIGVTEIASLRIAPTFATEEAVAAVMQASADQARPMAAQFAQSLNAARA